MTQYYFSKSLVNSVRVSPLKKSLNGDPDYLIQSFAWSQISFSNEIENTCIKKIPLAKERIDYLRCLYFIKSTSVKGGFFTFSPKALENIQRAEI